MLPQYQIDAAKALGGQIQQDYLGGAAPGAAGFTFPPTQTFVCYTQYGCPPTQYPPLCLGAAAPAAQGDPGTIFTEWCTLPPGAAAPAAAPGAGRAATGWPTQHTHCFICPPTYFLACPGAGGQGAAQGAAPGTIFTEWCTLPPGAAAPRAAAPGAVPPYPTLVWCPTFTSPPMCPGGGAQGGAPGTVFTEWCTLPPGAAAPRAAAPGAAPTYPTLVWCPTFTSPPMCPGGGAQGGAPGTIFTEWCTLPPGAAAPRAAAPGAAPTYPTLFWCPTFTSPPMCPGGGAQGGAPGTIFTEWCTLPPGAAAPAAAPGTAPTLPTLPFCSPTIFACPPPTIPPTLPPFCPLPVAAGAARGGAPGTVFTEWCTLPPGAAQGAAGAAQGGAPGTIFVPTAPPFCPPPVVGGTPQGGAPGTIFPTIPPVCLTIFPYCPPPVAAGAARGGAPGTVFTEWCTLPPGAAQGAAPSLPTVWCTLPGSC